MAARAQRRAHCSRHVSAPKYRSTVPLWEENGRLLSRNDSEYSPYRCRSLDRFRPMALRNIDLSGKSIPEVEFLPGMGKFRNHQFTSHIMDMVVDPKFVCYHKFIPHSFTTMCYNNHGIAYKIGL